MNKTNKIFKYIDGILHGYKPLSLDERESLIKDGWYLDANKAYEAMGKPRAKSDNEFRKAYSELTKGQQYVCS